MREIESLERLGRIHHSISKVIDNELADWRPELAPKTVVMSAIGRSIAINAKELSLSELNAIFCEIENQLNEGSESIRNAVATGLLEALLSAESNNELDFKLIAPHLGPKSIEYCREWDKFTGCRTDGLEE